MQWEAFSECVPVGLQLCGGGICLELGIEEGCGRKEPQKPSCSMAETYPRV